LVPSTSRVDAPSWGRASVSAGFVNLCWQPSSYALYNRPITTTCWSQAHTTECTYSIVSADLRGDRCYSEPAVCCYCAASTPLTRHILNHICHQLVQQAVSINYTSSSIQPAGARCIRWAHAWAVNLMTVLMSICDSCQGVMPDASQELMPPHGVGPQQELLATIGLCLVQKAYPY